MSLVLYHRTGGEAATSILADGFKDGTGTYLAAPHEFSGVWLSNVPLDVNEGAWGDVLLKVTLELSEADLALYEWVEEGKPYREWLVPAALINSNMAIEISRE